MTIKLFPGLVLVLGGILLGSSANAVEMRVSSDFSGGSAKVLNIDQTSNSIRVMPAGNPERGMRC